MKTFRKWLGLPFVFLGAILIVFGLLVGKGLKAVEKFNDDLKLLGKNGQV